MRYIRWVGEAMGELEVEFADVGVGLESEGGEAAEWTISN